MYKYSKEKISILTIFDKRRKNKAEKFPVKIQIIFNRTQKYYTTGVQLTVTEWDELLITKSKNLIRSRNDIKQAFDKVQKIASELIEKDEFSFDTLFNYLGYSTHTINDAFKEKIKSDRADGREGNAIMNECAFKHMEKYAGTKISFSSISPEWLKKYEQYMLKEEKSYSTIGMYMRCIRHLMKKATKSGHLRVQQYPFGKEKYQIPEGEGIKKALDMEQIKKIVRFEDGTEATARYRDLWFFIYLCNGINVMDLLKLKFKDVQEDEIRFYRNKSLRNSAKKKKIQVALTPDMKLIIQKWGNKHQEPYDFIFPFLTGEENPQQTKKKVQDITRRINRRLDKITKALGLPHISTYSARHSFATILKHKGVEISYISESLGHASLKTTENYLATFKKEKRLKNASLLTEFDE